MVIQGVTQYKKRLEQLKNLRQEAMARKKVLKEEQAKLQKKMEDLGYANIAELRKANADKKTRIHDLEGQIQEKLNKIEKLLAETGEAHEE